MRSRFANAWFTAALLIAACYSPAAPVGAPCGPGGTCPSGQHCVANVCELSSGGQPDGGSNGSDGGDCSAHGLSCDNGNATAFSCAGACVVMCSANVSQFSAESACRGWGGHLVAVTSSSLDNCLHQHDSGTLWIGLTQSDNATTPASGWSWIGGASLVGNYTNWESSQPDDGDGTENGAEQCGIIDGSGTWADSSCSQTHGFACR